MLIKNLKKKKLPRKDNIKWVRKTKPSNYSRSGTPKSPNKVVITSKNMKEIQDFKSSIASKNPIRSQFNSPK